LSVAMIVAGYAAHVGWSWWVAVVVGVVAGTAYSLEYVRDKHDFSVAKVAPQALTGSIAIHVTWTTAIYFIVRWLKAA